MGTIHVREHVLPGSHRTRRYITCVLPCIGVCTIVLGIFMFGAAVGVLDREDYHAAVTSVPFQSSSSVFLVPGILSLVAGIFLIIITSTRCTDASPPVVRKRSLWFVIILSVAGLLVLIATILGFVFIRKVDTKIEEDVRTKIKEYGLGGKYESTSHFDTLQSKDKCCGVKYYTDWRDTVWGAHRIDVVPDSCCKNYKYQCGINFEIRDINRQGCVEKVKSSVRGHHLLIAISGIIITLIKIALVIAVVYIRRKHLSN